MAFLLLLPPISKLVWRARLRPGPNLVRQEAKHFGGLVDLAKAQAGKLAIQGDVEPVKPLTAIEPVLVTDAVDARRSGHPKCGGFSLELFWRESEALHGCVSFRP